MICLDLTNGNVIWSQNIFNDIKSKKQNKIGTIQDLKIINNNISLFSNNGYMLSFNYKDGLLIDSNKISRAGLLSKPIFTDGAMYLIDKKKKLLTFR